MVKRVDLVSQGDYNRAYVHFDFWCDSTMTRAFKEKLFKKDQVRVVYDDPYYWIVLENTSTSYDPNKVQTPKKRIQLDDSLQTKKVKKVGAPAPMTMPMPMHVAPSIDYVHWLERENWRLQQMLNYTFEQMEMDIVMEKEVEAVEEDMELEIQASLHEDVEANNLWYQGEKDNMDVSRSPSSCVFASDFFQNEEDFLNTAFVNEEEMECGLE